MSYMKGLKCRECSKVYPEEALHVCELCFGPLEVDYDYDKIKSVLSREVIESRSPNMWRYRELLPIDNEPSVGLQSGFTPLIRATNLEKALGVKELYIKNDAVNFPTLSFKDRVVSVAVSRARELGFDTIACASTGNLANSVAANAAACGMPSYVFIPYDLEQTKITGTLIYGAKVVGIKGTYDEVNRLCSEVAGKYGWGFVNINLRPYYAEGSKTFGYEIAEQLGWRYPRHVIVPMAGGSLITKIWKSFKELNSLGIIPGEINSSIYGAQAAGCSPIVNSVLDNTNLIRPVKPKTIAKSLAIGNPADGFYSCKAIKESNGWGEKVTDAEIVDSMKLLAETEGIFAETAGGVTLGVTRKLIEQGRIPKDESIVVSITGNGLKTQEALKGHLVEPDVINAKLTEFDYLFEQYGAASEPVKA